MGIINDGLRSFESVSALLSRVNLAAMTLPTNSNDHPARPNFRTGSTGPVNRCHPPRVVQLSSRSLAVLRSELRRQPEIRQDVVARARALAADPEYPRIEILRIVAQQILRAPDLSEHDS
jgi:hypothetical protein